MSGDHPSEKTSISNRINFKKKTKSKLSPNILSEKDILNDRNQSCDSTGIIIKQDELA